MYLLMISTCVVPELCIFIYLIKNNLTVVVKMSHATTNLGRTLGMVVGFFLTFFIHLLNFTVRYQDMKKRAST